MDIVLDGKTGFKNIEPQLRGSLFLGAPTEIRTPVLALKGLRPGPLDDGGLFSGRILPSTGYQVKVILNYCHPSRIYSGVGRVPCGFGLIG